MINPRKVLIISLCFIANFSRDVIKDLPENVSTGVYFGWAQVDRSPVYMMVMSIGWNPFYKNVEKSMVGLKSFTYKNQCTYI